MLHPKPKGAGAGSSSYLMLDSLGAVRHEDEIIRIFRRQFRLSTLQGRKGTRVNQCWHWIAQMRSSISCHPEIMILNSKKYYLIAKTPEKFMCYLLPGQSHKGWGRGRFPHNPKWKEAAKRRLGRTELRVDTSHRVTLIETEDFFHMVVGNATWNPNHVLVKRWTVPKAQKSKLLYCFDLE